MLRVVPRFVDDFFLLLIAHELNVKMQEQQFRFSYDLFALKYLKKGSTSPEVPMYVRIAIARVGAPAVRMVKKNEELIL